VHLAHLPCALEHASQSVWYARFTARSWQPLQCAGALSGLYLRLVGRVSATRTHARTHYFFLHSICSSQRLHNPQWLMALMARDFLLFLLCLKLNEFWCAGARVRGPDLKLIRCAPKNFRSFFGARSGRTFPAHTTKTQGSDHRPART